jgi:hypothetical protein
MSQRRPAFSYKPVDHPRSAQMLFESGSADLLQPVALRPRMRDQFRPHEVIKYVIAVPAVAAAHESVLTQADIAGVRT